MAENLQNLIIIQIYSSKKNEVKVLAAQSCLILCKPMDCSPPGSAVHRNICQARISEWAAIPFSRGSSWPRDQTCPLHRRQILYHLSHIYKFQAKDSKKEKKKKKGSKRAITEHIIFKLLTDENIESSKKWLSHRRNPQKIHRWFLIRK